MVAAIPDQERLLGTALGAGAVATQHIPVSKARLEECLKSAGHWTNELPKYADRQQRKADRFAIAAGVIAAVTGASVYPVLDNVDDPVIRMLLALPAILAAALAVFPQVKRYGENAGRARELASAYGPLKGQLMDAVHAYGKPHDEGALRTILMQFETVKGKKDQLRDLPVPKSAKQRPRA